jgi:pSer/pThr/pTyr-binding forkhead associated (FHA) protein
MTRAIETGEALPKPSAAGLFGRSDPLPASVRAKLVIEAGPRAPATVPIDKSVVVLGRGGGIADVDVGDPSASRRHACITYRDGNFVLSDMGSTNGTVLNGETVGEAPLADGDQIQIGTAVIRFVNAG